MLKKKNRISRTEINQIFKNGFFVDSKNIFLKFLIKKEEKDKKIAFTTPKDVSKKANKRNLLRRRGYLAVKDVFNHLPEGFNGVFVFKKKALFEFGNKKTKTQNPNNLLLKEIKNILKNI